MKRLICVFASIVLCSLCVLTSCTNEEDSQESQEMRAKIQNTRWKMTEIYTEPDKYSYEKEWIPASRYYRLMINQLSFDDRGNYTSDDMHYSDVVGHNYAIHSGEYHVVGHRIYMQVKKTTHESYGNYCLDIRSLENDVMEAELNWVPNYAYYDDGNGNYQEKTRRDKDNMIYLIRLQRF